MAKPRVGIVDYLNSRPLAWDFLTGALADRYEPVYQAPAVVADMLASGEIDIGLIPSIEYQRISDLRVIPGACVASASAVRSVLLVSNVPFKDIKTLALDANSRTSATLVRILLKDLYSAAPAVEPREPNLERMLRLYDAALIIGDPALRIPVDREHVLDLATAWKQLTGRPFVFAFWAIRRDAIRDGLVDDFRRSLGHGLENLPTLAARAASDLELSEADMLGYLENNLSYELGGEEISGLEEFYDRAQVGPGAPRPLRFVQDCGRQRP